MVPWQLGSLNSLTDKVRRLASQVRARLPASCSARRSLHAQAAPLGQQGALARPATSCIASSHSGPWPPDGLRRPLTRCTARVRAQAVETFGEHGLAGSEAHQARAITLPGASALAEASGGPARLRAACAPARVRSAASRPPCAPPRDPLQHSASIAARRCLRYEPGLTRPSRRFAACSRGSGPLRDRSAQAWTCGRACLTGWDLLDLPA